MNTAIERLQSLLVQDVMARDVVWVTTRQHMADIASILIRHNLSTAPVVDEHGMCVGILSASDFLKRDAVESAPDAAPHKPRPAWTPDDVALTYMSSGVQSVPSTAPLLHAARIMCAQHVHRLPVVDHSGKPVGIISTMDIVAALLNALAEQGIVV